MAGKNISSFHTVYNFILAVNSPVPNLEACYYLQLCLLDTVPLMVNNGKARLPTLEPTAHTWHQENITHRLL